MNQTVKQLGRSLRNRSRRSFLTWIAASLSSGFCSLRAFSTFLGSLRPEKSAQVSSLTPGALDLHGIFSDEIRANFKDNVYVALGNKLQLDGEAYVQVARALATYDFLSIIRNTPMPESARRRLVSDQIATSEQALGMAVDSLDWPKYTIDLGAAEIKASGPANLELLAQKNQPLLFAFHNTTLAVQRVHLASQGINFPVMDLGVEPHSSRYLLASVSPEEKGDLVIKLNLTTEGASRELAVALDVVETGILEGLLVTDAQEAEPPIARVRVTDTRGRYFAPEVQPSGLIRMIPESGATKAERWAYAEGKFQVRVPVGRIRVSIRRGIDYRSLDEEIEVTENGVLRREFVLRRWTDPEKDGYYAGDMHVHMLDLKTALFEGRAEGLRVVNVMVFKHLDDTYAREHFTGAADPISDGKHFIRYNEEYRNEPLGHIGLLNLRKIVEPISTGRLGLHWPTLMRFESLNMPLPLHGDNNSPDYPLLVQAMRETHKQGGLVDWAHLRSGQWEFPLDAEEGQIDFADIMTHTEIPQDLALWYALLNCGFHIPAVAGTDRIEPTSPIGHQRVYVQLDAPMSYENWMKGLKGGSSFVTNGPMLRFTVSGIEPGGEIRLPAPTVVNVSASALSQLPVERLEIIANGKIIRTATTVNGGLAADIAFDHSIGESEWIAARCTGLWNKELFYSNPVFAHTSPVYIRYRDDRIEKPESARYLLGFMQKLEQWALKEAHFNSPPQKEEVLKRIRTGINYFQKIADKPGPS